MSKKKQSRREFLGKVVGAVVVSALNPVINFLEPKEIFAVGNGFSINLADLEYAYLSDPAKHFSIFIKFQKQSKVYSDLAPPPQQNLPYAFVITRTSAAPLTFVAVQGYCSHGLYALED